MPFSFFLKGLTFILQKTKKGGEENVRYISRFGV